MTPSFTHYQSTPPAAHSRRGFTLIEISIVLVVIGFLASGVVLGRELISAYQLRNVASDLEKFRTATMAFKLKYDTLPGDMFPEEAAKFGLFQITAPCGPPCTFGDGHIGNSSANPTFVTEIYAYWRHLSEAGMLGANYASDLKTNGEPNIPSPATTEEADAWDSNNLPKISYTKSYWRMIPTFSRWIYDPNTGTTNWTGEIKQNYFIVGASITNNPMLINQIWAIDTKIDDGKPNTGKMFELFSALVLNVWDANPTSGKCSYGGVNQHDPAALYNIISDHSGHQYIYCMGVMSADF